MTNKKSSPGRRLTVIAIALMLLWVTLLGFAQIQGLINVNTPEFALIVSWPAIVAVFACGIMLEKMEDLTKK